MVNIALVASLLIFALLCAAYVWRCVRLKRSLNLIHIFQLITCSYGLVSSVYVTVVSLFVSPLTKLKEQIPDIELYMFISGVAVFCLSIELTARAFGRTIFNLGNWVTVNQDDDKE